jgi:hypothetical protein
MKGRSKTETIEGVRFEIHELTMGTILDWEQDIEQQILANNVSATDQLLVDDFSLTDIANMLGKSVDDLRDIPPSVLEQLAGHCKEVNSHFFQLRAKLVGPLKSALELARWANPSRPSSVPAIRKPGIIRSLFSWLSSKS